MIIIAFLEKEVRFFFARGWCQRYSHVPNVPKKSKRFILYRQQLITSLVQWGKTGYFRRSDHPYYLKHQPAVRGLQQSKNGKIQQSWLEKQAEFVPSFTAFPFLTICKLLHYSQIPHISTHVILQVQFQVYIQHHELQIMN